MRSFHRAAIAACTAALLTLSSALAQFSYNLNYDYYPRMVYTPISYSLYGWSGWGVPPQMQAEVARGMALYAQNASQAKSRAAQTKSQAQRAAMIHAWNLFLWTAEHTRYLVLVAREHPEAARSPAEASALWARIRDRPTADEVASGQALNALLDQLTDPRIPVAARSARTPLNPRLIRQIPFEYSSEVIAVLLERLTSERIWPAYLQGPAFDRPHSELREAITAAVEEDRAGELRPDTVRRVHRALGNLARTASAVILRNHPSYAKADTYLRQLTAVARLLGKPDLEGVLKPLEKSPKTTVEDLLSFMQMFNLRFGPATTASQRSAYETLHVALTRWRSGLAQRLRGRLPEGAPSLQEVAPALTILSGLSWDELVGKTPPDAKAGDSER